MRCLNEKEHCRDKGNYCRFSLAQMWEGSSQIQVSYVLNFKSISTRKAACSLPLTTGTGKKHHSPLNSQTHTELYITFVNGSHTCFCNVVLECLAAGPQAAAVLAEHLHYTLSSWMTFFCIPVFIRRLIRTWFYECHWIFISLIICVEHCSANWMK